MATFWLFTFSRKLSYSGNSDLLLPKQAAGVGYQQTALEGACASQCAHKLPLLVVPAWPYKQYSGSLLLSKFGEVFWNLAPSVCKCRQLQLTLKSLFWSESFKQDFNPWIV